MTATESEFVRTFARMSKRTQYVGIGLIVLGVLFISGAWSMSQDRVNAEGQR